MLASDVLCCPDSCIYLSILPFAYFSFSLLLPKDGRILSFAQLALLGCFSSIEEPLTSGAPISSTMDQSQVLIKIDAMIAEFLSCLLRQVVNLPWFLNSNLEEANTLGILHRLNPDAVVK